MNARDDNPGVIVPPPFIYFGFFLLSVGVQQLLPIRSSFFGTEAARWTGLAFVVLCLGFDLSGLIQFFRSRNTLITVKPASSLQTKGIYSFSRNPMYTGLMCLYVGLGFLLGNWWTFIFAPFVWSAIQFYVIRREERYLERQFGQEYQDYRRKVRRWI